MQMQNDIQTSYFYLPLKEHPTIIPSFHVRTEQVSALKLAVLPAPNSAGCVHPGTG